MNFGAAFEGERVRKDDLYAECGGGKTQAVEWVTSKRMEEVEDGKVEVFGPDLPDLPQDKIPMRLPLAIVVEVAGRAFQPDFEPILERQIHHLVNYAQGVMHIGQRDIAWYRIGKAAVEKGFTLKHIGTILHAKFHQDFGAIFDKVQIKIYTEPEKVKEITEQSPEDLQRAGRPGGEHAGRNHRDLLLLHPVPVLRPQPRLRGQPGAYRSVRRLQLDGLQGLE